MRRIVIIAMMLLVFSMLTIHRLEMAARMGVIYNPVHNMDTGLSYPTIQKAIDAPETLNGHTIVCDPWNYTEYIDVYKSLNIIGAGADLCSIYLPPLPIEVDCIKIRANNVMIKGFTIISVSGYYGIRLEGVSGCIITENVFTGNGSGILIKGSSANIISNNVLHSLPGNGIDIRDSSHYNRVVGNRLNQNHYGIIIWNASSYNLVSSNLVNSSEWSGIRLNWLEANLALVEHNNITNNFLYCNHEGIMLDYPSGDNLLKDNMARNNYIGIRIRQSNNNTVVSNTLISNGFRGVSVESSFGNIFYDNFFNNTINAFDNGANLWNTTKQEGLSIIGRSLIGGNYWSDYVEADPDNDGIGNQPYSILGGGNKDNLPLVQSYVKVYPLEYDSSTQTGRIRFEISPKWLYRSAFKVNETDFDQVHLPPRNYYERRTYSFVNGDFGDCIIACTTNVSEPKVPIIRLMAWVPFEPDVEIPPWTCELLKAEYVGVIGNVLLAPVEKYEAPMGPPKYELNEEIYNSYRPYPAEFIGRLRVEAFYGIPVVTIDVHPIRYIPAARKIELYRISGSIVFKKVLSFGVPRSVGEPVEAALKRFISNYYEARFWPTPTLQIQDELKNAVISSVHFTGSQISQQMVTHPLYRVLVISADDFAQQAALLAVHKSTVHGMAVEGIWVTVSEIIDVMRGLVPTGSDIPYMIRQYIRILYDLLRVRYVILLGDVSIIGVSCITTFENYTWKRYPLGNDTNHQAYAQSFKAGANSVISLTLAINRTINQPNYDINVSIRAYKPDGPVLTSFIIDKSQVNHYNINTWTITKHFSYVVSPNQYADLSPTECYYVVINATGVDSNRYYWIYTLDSLLGVKPSYESHGCFYICYNPQIAPPEEDPATGQPILDWKPVPNEDLIFRLQIYNSTSVPARYVKETRPHDLGDPDFPCDFYYACVSPLDSWDPDEDGIYAESNEYAFIDFLYEVAVGRLPADCITEASKMVDRIISYETNPPPFKKGSVLYKAPNSFQNGAVGPIQNILNTYIRPAHWTNNSSTFVHLFNNIKVDAVYTWAHGGPINIGSGNGAILSPEGNGGNPIVYPSATLIETSHFPVVYAYSCRTAYFDVNPSDPIYGRKDGIGEAFVVSGVASSYIGWLRVGWGFNDNFGVTFWQYYCETFRSGDALMLTKSFFHNRAGLVTQLFGDPETYHQLPDTPTCYVTVSPPEYCPGLPVMAIFHFGENITFTFANKLNYTVYLPSTASWEIVDPRGITLYSPTAYQVIVPVNPGGNVSWTWDQRLADGSPVTMPGRYRLRLYTLNGTWEKEFWILEENAAIFTDCPYYYFGERVTLGFRNLKDTSVTVTLIVRKGGVIIYRCLTKLAYSSDWPGLAYSIDWPAVSINTGHLIPTGKYLLEAIVTDEVGKTDTYSTTFTIIPPPPFTKIAVEAFPRDINGGRKHSIPLFFAGEQ